MQKLKDMASFTPITYKIVGVFFGQQCCATWINQNLLQSTVAVGEGSPRDWPQVFCEAAHTIWQLRNRIQVGVINP